MKNSPPVPLLRRGLRQNTNGAAQIAYQRLGIPLNRLYLDISRREANRCITANSIGVADTNSVISAIRQLKSEPDLCTILMEERWLKT